MNNIMKKSSLGLVTSRSVGYKRSSEKFLYYMTKFDDVI